LTNVQMLLYVNINIEKRKSRQWNSKENRYMKYSYVPDTSRNRETSTRERERERERESSKTRRER
jgi:hypothetical protein